MRRNTSPTKADLYQHFRKYVPNMLTWLGKRFDIDDAGCWIWRGAPTAKHGYGMTSIGPRHDQLVIYAHRLSYMVYRGDPAGLFVLHRCDVPLCFRPDHLFLGTAGDNVRDAVAKKRHRNQNAGRTHCRNGHLLTGKNVRVDTTGFRRCVVCRREYEARYRRR